MLNIVGQHSPQPFPWGCMHHSLHALTGDSRLLEDTTECSVDRFLFLAQSQWGYFFKTLWADDSMEQITGPDWWQRVIGERYMFPYNSPIPPQPPVSGMALLLGVKSRKYKDLGHCVAALVRPGKGLPVTVFDPGEPEAFEFASLEAFAESPYGWATHVWQVSAGVSEAFRSIYGPSMAHVTPADRKRWEKTRTEMPAPPKTTEPSHTAV